MNNIEQIMTEAFAEKARQEHNNNVLLRERVAKIEEAAALTVRGYRRWKHNQKRGGDRNEADNGMTDLSQGIWELAELLEPSEQASS